MKTLSKSLGRKRIDKDTSGSWGFIQEAFPIQQTPDILFRKCGNAAIAQVKGSLADSADALPQPEFFTHIKKVLAEITQDLENKWKRERANEAVDLLSKIVSVTTRLFGEDVKVYENCDPEFPRDKWVVFAVTTSMDVERIVQAEQEWVKAVTQVAACSDKVRLSISPQ